jgi:hypothetical protein
MGQYGRAACTAAKQVEEGKETSPRAAWVKAIRRLTKSPSSRNKPSPRTTFLSLCEEGLVEGVPAGVYTDSPEHKAYALQALEALRADPDLADDPRELWAVVTKRSGKLHNGQMDVVASLWQQGRLPS